jgi:hypothetical protein
LILLEFDDRLRVVVSSSNLYRFQDFYKKQEKSTSSCEFGQYLENYVQKLCPKNYTRPVFRKEIDLKKYDFSTAKVKLIGSINGRYNGEELWKYGLKRLEFVNKGGLNIENIFGKNCHWKGKKIVTF